MNALDHEIGAKNQRNPWACSLFQFQHTSKTNFFFGAFFIFKKLLFFFLTWDNVFNEDHATRGLVIQGKKTLGGSADISLQFRGKVYLTLKKMLLWEHLTRAWVAGIATQLMFSKTRKGVLLDPTYSSGPWHRFSKHIHLAIYTSHFKVGSLPWEFCIMIICIVLHPKILCSLSHTKKIFVYLFGLRWAMLAVGISPGCRTLWLVHPIWSHKV